MIATFVLASILQGAFGGSLLNIGRSQSTAKCCQDNNALLCSSVTINTNALGDETIELPFGITVKFSNMIPGNQLSYHYVGNTADIVFTFNTITNSLHGHASTLDGRSFVIENCGQDGHVFKEINTANLGEDIAVVEKTTGKRSANQPGRTLSTQERTTFSVKIYYTPEFADATPDIDGFLDQVIAETNQGYMNSGVNLILIKHCSELASIYDGTDLYNTFIGFKYMKGDIATLRGSADTAALITSNAVGGICGLGSLNVIASGDTVSLTAKPCALGYFSFGHEIGHNIGLHHDPARVSNTAYPYGHGHLIAAGNDTPGLRTILAYNAPGHYTRVNYYSNPDINHPLTGTPLGVEGLSDNVRLLNEKAVSLAAIGDESINCEGSTSSTYCGLPNKVPKMLKTLKLLDILSPEKCNELCSGVSNCDFWSWKTETKALQAVCNFFKAGLQDHNVKTSGPATC